MQTIQASVIKVDSGRVVRVDVDDNNTALVKLLRSGPSLINPVYQSLLSLTRVCTSSTLPNSALTMLLISLIFIFPFALIGVDGGCAELRLCCPGRNMSCIALDTTRPKSNALVPNTRENVQLAAAAAAEIRRKGVGRVGGAWHIHVDQGTNLDRFEGSLNGGDRFFESLFAPSSSLGNPTGGQGGGEGGKEESRLENVVLAKEDEDEFQSIHQSTDEPDTSTVGENGDGSAEGDYGGSGEEETYASVDWLNSVSKEEDKEKPFVHAESSSNNDTTEKPKIDNYKIVENDRYELVSPDHVEFGEGDEKMIRYVIKTDEIPVTIEQLEMLQNYRSLTGGADRHCYCDEACQVLADCCSDYATVCPVVDCMVTEWSGWSPCQASGHHQKYVPTDQNQCGMGISRKERRVVRQPMHGGKACPILEEQRTCYTTDSPQCLQSHLQEIAHLLPYEYGRARVPGYKNNSAGIFYDLPKDVFKFNAGKTHCITYEITWFNPACDTSDARRNLQPGRRICMECQPTAQNTGQSDRCVGQGLQGQQSAWNLIGGSKQCYGFWKQLGQEKNIENCKCEIEFANEARYLFV